MPDEVPGAEDALKSQDRSWFEPLVFAVERDALGFAMTLTHNREQAEEIVQQALTNIWASKHTPREPAEFKRWLYRSILNLARDQVRRQRRWSLLRVFTPPPPDPLDEVERRANDAALVQALRQLGTRERAAVHLRFLEGRSFAEAGQLLGVSEENARVIVHRALRKMRESMGPAVVVGGAEA